MFKSKLRLGLIFIDCLVTIFFGGSALACTDFRIIAKDGNVLITRSLEFGLDFKSNLRSSPRGRSFNNQTADGKPALSWKAKYGYLYVDGLNIPLAVDGLNEKGLSFEYLYLPNETTYQSLPADKTAQGIPYLYFGDWILGNFATVEEVRAALSNVYVYEQKLAALENVIFPLHAAIYDETGKGIIVEFIDGKMKIHNNEVGILTNSPPYEWQTTNLRNYINLSPYTPQPVKAEGLTFLATGQGSGMVGLPGDVSPPSRFVKTFILVTTAISPKNINESLNLAQHVINNVDIPFGLVRAKSQGADQLENTQWVVFKDLKNRKLYYRTYDNMTLRGVSLSEVNFDNTAAELKMPMATGYSIEDLSKKFTSSPQ